MMFFVYKSRNDDFHCIGAFSKKDEADAFWAENRVEGKDAGAVVEQTWDVMLDTAVKTHLGALADMLMPAKDLPDPVLRLKDWGVNLDHCQSVSLRNLFWKHASSGYLERQRAAESGSVTADQ